MKDWLYLVSWLLGAAIALLNLYLAKMLVDLQAKMQDWSDQRYVRKDVFEVELRRLAEAKSR